MSISYHRTTCRYTHTRMEHLDSTRARACCFQIAIERHGEGQEGVSSNRGHGVLHAPERSTSARLPLAKEGRVAVWGAAF